MRKRRHQVESNYSDYSDFIDAVKSVQTLKKQNPTSLSGDNRGVSLEQVAIASCARSSLAHTASSASEEVNLVE